MSMFGSKKDGKTSKSEVKQITTSIGEGCIFEGNISTSSSSRIDGTLRGKITGDNCIIIGEQGVIIGEIKAAETIVFGKVDGIIESERLEIKHTGSVKGDLFVEKLNVEEGGIYNGKCAMGAKGHGIPNEVGPTQISDTIEFERKAAKVKEK